MYFLHGLRFFVFLYVLLFLFTALLSVSQVLAEKVAPDSKLKEKVIIITPYPVKFLDGYRRAFESLYPQYDTQVIKMKTTEGIEHLKKSREENTVDLFWASSVDAFETLKAEGLLQPYKSGVQGIPAQIAGVPVNDKDRYYSGFAFSGIGLMWNERLLKTKGVHPPADWEDLIHADYFNLLAMSSPSRSSTTHIAVEGILQTRGWDAGWKLVQQIGANLQRVTTKSSDVPRGVSEGEYGVGVVIDYFGLTDRARRFPVDFRYPQPAIMFPANIALIKNAPHPEPGKLFIDFLLSAEGQYLLLSKNIRRLPIRMETYASAPDGYPNPFQKTSIGKTYTMDFKRSKQRYQLVNSLFDSLVTYNLDALKQAQAAIYQLQEKLEKKPNEKARRLMLQAEAVLYRVPVSEQQSLDPGFTRKFTQKRDYFTEKLPQEQQQIESRWQESIGDRYQKALALAKEGLEL